MRCWYSSNLQPRHSKFLLSNCFLSGDVFETLDKCIKEGLQISVVGMGAEVRILREIAQRSKGTYAVALDAQVSARSSSCYEL